MKPIQYRWIEAFRAVARTGSTIDAARMMAMDQSAVSRHVSALEGQIGVSLFDRRQRRLTLSAAGLELLTEAEAAIDALDRFRQKADAVSQRTTGHLRVVTTASLARGLLPAAIAAFREIATHVTINVVVAARADLENAVEGQQFDLAAVALPFAYPARHTVTLGQFSGVCVIPKQHPLAQKKRLRVKDLAETELVGLPEATIGRLRLEELFAAEGFLYRPTAETTAVALNELVAAGFGIAVTDPFTARSADRDKTVIRPLAPTVSYAFAILFPIKGPRSPLAADFAATAKSVLPSMS